jgi:hypothetical protein
MGHIPFLETQFALSAKQQHELHLESDDTFLRNENNWNSTNTTLVNLHIHSGSNVYISVSFLGSGAQHRNTQLQSWDYAYMRTNKSLTWNSITQHGPRNTTNKTINGRWWPEISAVNSENTYITVYVVKMYLEIPYKNFKNYFKH